MAKQKEKLPTTTVGELVAKLLQMDQNAPVVLKIGSPDDAVWTSAEIDVEPYEDGSVKVEGYVFSDDEDAYFPGISE